MTNKFKRLIEYLVKMPGIGPRQATRMVLAMLDWTESEINDFSSSISDLKNGPMLCKECFNFADDEKCAICKSPKRDQTRIAVVEKVTDLESMEKSTIFNGVYHVLGGAINPARGNLPEKLKVSELINRIKNLQELTPDIEVILATNPNTYGDTTALYLEQELHPLNIKVTRLARGLSSGSLVEYADEITLANALKHRR